MELVLEVISPERHLLGDNASHRFLPAGGVIGRSAECDWVIPDQTRHLSGRHAIVSFEAGQFFITDISTNGTYLNGPEPLSRNLAVPLHDEDRLLMGELQFRVRLLMDYGQARSAYAAPSPAIPAAPPVSLASIANSGSANLSANPMAAVDAFVAERQRQAEAVPQDWHWQSPSMPDSVRPEQEAFVPPRAHPPALDLDEDPPMGELPEDWDLSEVGLASRPRLKPVAPPTPSVAPRIPTPGFVSADPARPAPHLPASIASVVTAASPAAAPEKTGQQQGDDALLAFAEGSGLPLEALRNAGGDAVLRRAGALLRLCLQGYVANAQARASLKNEFRLDMTLVNAHDNNPIKFCANGDQALRHLLADDAGSFQPLEDAVWECVEDSRQHQLAMMAGMQGALQELLVELSPAALERRFGQRWRGTSLRSKGARCWDAYRELHRDLTDDENLFDSLFADPFARAYDEQINQLKHSARKKG